MWLKFCNGRLGSYGVCKEILYTSMFIPKCLEKQGFMTSCSFLLTTKRLERRVFSLRKAFPERVAPSFKAYLKGQIFPLS